MIQILTQVVTWTIFVHALLITTSYLLLTVLASRDLQDLARARRSEPPIDLFSLPLTPPISVLVPAYNEEAGIAESVSALLGLNYPEFEVIVVSDGSKDGTLETLSETFSLEPYDRVIEDVIDAAPITGVFRAPHHPNLIVIDKENGGKADALNVGINAARYPLVCSIDADSILESDALLKSVTPIVHRPDLTIATGGIIRIANGAEFEGGTLVRTGVPKNLLARFQLIEYLRAFIVGRSGWNRIRALLIVSGAFGVFRRDVLLEVGGYRADTVGEDLELILRLHRHMRDQNRPYRIEFVPDPVCWTEAPESLSVLKKQRTRWQRGLLETLGIHRGMLFNRRYGRLGTVALPYFLIFELLGPVVETIGLFLVAWLAWQGALSFGYALLLIGASLAVGFVMSIASLVFEEAAFQRYPRWRQTGALLLFTVLENFGYRQINGWWRLVGLWQGFRGRSAWGAMQRTGSLGGQSSTLDTGPNDYWALREKIDLALGNDSPVEAEHAEVAATFDTPTPLVALRTAPPPPLDEGPAEPAVPPTTPPPPTPTKEDGGTRVRRRERRWNARRLYTSAICGEFVQDLNDDILARSEPLFRTLWRMGRVDSELLAESLGCAPRSVSGLLMTPLARRANDLGLPLPYAVSRVAGTGRRLWRDQGDVAARMTIAIQKEITRRTASDTRGPVD